MTPIETICDLIPFLNMEDVEDLTGTLLQYVIENDLAREWQQANKNLLIKLVDAL